MSDSVPESAANSPEKPVTSDVGLEPELLPAPVSEPVLAKPARPKRLTLQERLALAAKGKKKSGAANAETKPQTPKEAVDVETPAKIEEKVPESPEKPTEQPQNDQLAILQAELTQLRSTVRDLNEENALLKASAVAASNSADSERKLAEKEATIKQLMEEGEALSKKELRLNDRIKTLAQTNSKLETSLKAYSEKNEETSLKLSEIEEIMKVHKLKSVDQLLKLLDDSNVRLKEAQQELEREKAWNWEAKYRELQRIYETELNEKKSYIKQLNDSTLQLQMLQGQSKLDVQSKDDLIAQLNQEMLELRDENNSEISRLEAKVENLRLENESFLKMSQNGSKSSQEEVELHHKQIEYEEFAKLSETHRNLQDQYVSSQESWKLIESNLLSKVDNLTSSLESLRKSKLKNTNEARKLNNQLLAQDEQIQKLKHDITLLKEENKGLELKLQVKESEYAELEEKIEELKTVFGADRQNYDIKIKTLSETIQKYEDQNQIYQASASSDTIGSLQSRRMRDSGLHINMDARLTPMRNYSSNSMASFGTPMQQWDDSNASINVPTTPFGMEHHFSSTSLNDEIHPNDAADSGPADYSFGYRDTPTLTATHTPSLPNSGATKNIQLINKMSSSIRRLEIELMNLKEENEQLATEKDTAQQEIVGKYELEKKVASFAEATRKLEEEVAARAKKEETLLEVIGEKSERVAELQADVVDLKDLCRQQVQQMILMAEK